MYDERRPDPMEVALARSREQEELVEKWLRLQKVPRQVRTLAQLAGLSRDDTRAALHRLENKRKATYWRGCWKIRKAELVGGVIDPEVLRRKTDDELRASVNEFTQDDPPPYNFLPRCTCSWRGTRVKSEGAASDQVAAHLADDTDPNVGPNCVPWIEAS